jgi:DNA-binding MarR family transcriptional regulator
MDQRDDANAAREDAAAAMRRLRDAAGQLLSTLADAQPVAPHHLLTLRAVADGAHHPSDVASVTGRHASSASRVVDQLVELGLLDRTTDPADRRQVLVSLTDAGRTVVTRFERLDGAISTRLMAGFAADDATRLAGYLDRLAGEAATMAEELEADPTRLERVDRA